MPDFDIDFCQDRRGEVIDYVQQRYGRDQVAQIITFGTLQARGVLRDVGRVLQMPYGQVDKLTKLVPQNPAAPVTLAAAIAGEPKLQAFRDEDAVVARAFDIAQRLEGLTRHASTHAAGIVIGDRPLSELVPLYRDPKSDMPVTQFNMKWVEPAGLVKFDFLGLKTLTVLDVAVKLLRQRGVELDLATLPLDDAASYQMLARGDVVGVFQVESQGMRRALVDMRPDRFEDIIALVALYRPGPMANIPTYCARKHGDEEPEYLHPMLEPILKETFGVIIYQEQVMQIAQVMAGYSLGEADLLRRAMGKKIRSEMEKQRERFVSGAIERGIQPGQADTIFELLAKFADYGFNKSHAAAYALVSYHTAYMKAHHPVEFLAASMTLELNNTDKLSEFRAEAQRLGIKVEAPSINRSGATFEVDNGIIYYALAALKGVGPQAIELIAEVRRDGLFTSLADFAARVNPRAINKRVIESLAAAGAFDALDSNRARVFAGAEAILAACQRSHEAATMGQNDMFGGAADAPTIMLPQIEPWLPAERLRREYDAIGFFLSGHPLDDYATVLKRLRVQSWAEFSRAVKTGATAGKVAATVVSRMERRTKTGNKMGIIGLSDPTGHFEAVLFSEGLAQYRELLEPGAAVLLQLGAELQGEDVRARVLHAEPLDDAAAKTQKGLRIFVRDTRPLDSIAQAAAVAGSRGVGRFGPRCPGQTGSRGRRRRRRVAGDDARPRDRGGNEVAGPLQGLAADRRRDQGCRRRGGRANAVGDFRCASCAAKSCRIGPRLPDGLSWSAPPRRSGCCWRKRPAPRISKAPPKPQNVVSPGAALERLQKGNMRYVKGASRRHDFEHEREALAGGQNPFAGILSCADSRIAPEYAFDSGRGDLFVCRVAGNFATTETIASLEYGVAVLGVPLILVLGHDRCGAVDAAIKSLKDGTTLPGHLPSLVDGVAPAVNAVLQQGGDTLGKAIRQNVIDNVAKLRSATPILSAAVEQNKLKVVGGIYRLKNGRVDMVA